MNGQGFDRGDDRRPFDFTDFVLMPRSASETLVYHRDQCERIRAGRTGIVITDHEDGESDFWVLHRTLEGELLAVGYLSLVGHVPVVFVDLVNARDFLKHLRTCPTPERAPQHLFIEAKTQHKHHADVADEDVEDFDEQ
jgi:hypothetical protein